MGLHNIENFYIHGICFDKKLDHLDRAIRWWNNAMKRLGRRDVEVFVKDQQRIYRPVPIHSPNPKEELWRTVPLSRNDPFHNNEYTAEIYRKIHLIDVSLPHHESQILADAIKIQQWPGNSPEIYAEK